MDGDRHLRRRNSEDRYVISLTVVEKRPTAPEQVRRCLEPNVYYCISGHFDATFPRIPIEAIVILNREPLSLSRQYRLVNYPVRIVTGHVELRHEVSSQLLESVNILRVYSLTVT